MVPRVRVGERGRRERIVRRLRPGPAGGSPISRQDGPRVRVLGTRDPVPVGAKIRRPGWSFHDRGALVIALRARPRGLSC